MLLVTLYTCHNVFYFLERSARSRTARTGYKVNNNLKSGTVYGVPDTERTVIDKELCFSGVLNISRDVYNVVCKITLLARRTRP